MPDSPTKSTGIPMSLDTFHKCAKQALINLLAMRFSLQIIYDLYFDKKELSEENLQYILQIIESYKEPVQNLRQLLENRQLLPSVVISLRYQLEVSVYYASEQLSVLIKLIEQFSSCHRPSTKKERLRQQIFCKLKIITRTQEDILYRIPALLNQPCFQEKRTAGYCIMPHSQASKSGVIIPMRRKILSVSRH